MKLKPRHRHDHRDRTPRVAISQAEITADLFYPAHQREALPQKRRRAPR